MIMMKWEGWGSGRDLFYGIPAFLSRKWTKSRKPLSH